MPAMVLYVAVCLLGFALVQRRLAKTPVTGPMIFVALGLLASASALGIIETESDDTVVVVVNVVFQATLVLVLFTDASALHFGSWREDGELPSRLLGIGLPLTIALGTIIAALLFTDLGIWEAAIIGAIIAPTDAALGQAVISNPRVPERIRQALDVESGLNDGVSLPFVLIFIALAGEGSDTGAVAIFVREIGVAVGVGVAVGFLGGWLLVRASEAGWMGPVWSSIAVIAIAVIAFIVADVGGGSGFIATFTAGLAYGYATRGKIKANEDLAASLGLALVQVSFLLFGALVLEPVLGALTWQLVLMAVLGLTIVRIGPVAVSMIGSKMAGQTVLYLGWFGPRGLATIVFAVLVVTDADLAGTETIVAAAAITVGLSVLAHGLTAYPGSQRYADWYAAQEDAAKLPEGKPVHHHRFSTRARQEAADVMKDV
jgi:NhaP-type Na+/H+ or K+/H+ antiporter